MIFGAKSLVSPCRMAFSQIHFNRTAPTHKHTQDVQLRGVVLKGRYEDLPNMIFLPEAFDMVDNWVPFFTNPDNKVLNYRNVHIVYPRNFGNSDRHESFDIEDVANDVLRYMWENKLSTATLAGHGYGAKVAMATGCYYSERSTGVIAVDYSPMDLRYHEAYRELKGYVNQLTHFNLNQSKADLEKNLKETIQCPKWRSIFHQNITKVGGQNEFRFDLHSINKNMQFNKADSLANWPIKTGLYSGRASFVFPEYSRYVHMGTNTLPMLKVCPRVKGFGVDIHSIPGDENTLNHWMYEFPEQAFDLSRKMSKFISMYDGVHVLLQDRTEVGKAFIPDRIYSRNAGHVYGDYSPAHLHHNWRFDSRNQ